MTKRVAIGGSSGYMGGALRRHLVERGDEVVRLVRHEPRSTDEMQWDPASGQLDPGVLAEVDAVVNLGGAGLGDHRWTADYKRVILASRLDTTTTLAQAVAAERRRSGRKVRMVSASAVGYYGDRGDEVLTENSQPGRDFLASVVTKWERATEPASEAGAPVATIRTGLVMGPGGGAFGPILRLARLGLGGPLGNGKQWWPWISLLDGVRAISHLIDQPDLTGPFNLAAPGEARQGQIARSIGEVLGRPALLPAPEFALRLVVGGFAEGIVASQRVRPERLVDSGFQFAHPDVQSAIRWTVAR
jgi:hypothetical protein